MKSYTKMAGLEKILREDYVGPEIDDIVKNRILQEARLCAKNVDINQLEELYLTSFDVIRYDPKMHYYLALTYAQMGKHERAIEYYPIARCFGAVNAELYINWCISLWHLKKYHKVEQVAYQGLNTLHETNMEMYEFLRNSQKMLNKKITPRVVLIGDSHLRYFRYMIINGDFPRSVVLQFLDHGGATALGLMTPVSVARKHVLETMKKKPKTEHILFYFGEIDCRRAAWKYANDTQQDIYKVIEETLENYFAFINTIQLLGYPNISIIGVILPITPDELYRINSKRDLRTPFVSQEARTKLTLYFNERLQQHASRQSFGYFDITEMMLNPETGMADEKFIPDYCLEAHCRFSEIVPIYKDILTKHLCKLELM